MIETNTIWGVRSKKLAGINDYANHITAPVVFSSIDNSIDFAPLLVPSFFKEKQFIRVFGGNNDSRLFRIEKIFEGTKIQVQENLIDDTETVRITARLWEIHNDPSISRPSSTGSTMFNVHNRNTTGYEDGSGVAITFAEHYHDEEGTEDDVGEIISTEYNELGCRSKVIADCCDSPAIDLGPQLIFDDDGNVMRVKKDDLIGGNC